MANNDSPCPGNCFCDWASCLRNPKNPAAKSLARDGPRPGVPLPEAGTTTLADLDALAPGRFGYAATARLDQQRRKPPVSKYDNVIEEIHPGDPDWEHPDWERYQ